MEKKLFFVPMFLAMGLFPSQSLESADFNTLNTGTLGTQGGFTTSGGAVTDYQITTVDATHGNSLQITGASGTTPTKYVYITNGVSKGWTNRSTTNNVYQVNLEFYTGSQAGTGVGTIRSVTYTTGYTPIVGIVYDFPTKTIKGYGRMSVNGTAGNYLFTLGTQTFEPNTWIPVSYTYDSKTGNITWTYPEGTYYKTAGIIGTNTYTMQVGVDPGEMNFISTVTTGNTVAHIASFDNYKAEAVLKDNITLSAKEVKGIQNAITVYPNPTTDYIYISGLDHIQSVDVIDTTGKKVSLSYQKQQIDVRKLPKGLYILVINSEEGQQHLKFLKK